MAGMAKLMGVVCWVTSFGLAMFVMAVVVTEEVNADTGILDPAFVLALEVGALTLLFAAVGVGLFLLAEISEGGVWLRQRQVEPPQQPVERPYGATTRT